MSAFADFARENGKAREAGCLIDVPDTRGKTALPTVSVYTQSKADFIRFLSQLEGDFNGNQQEWENQRIPDYLESIAAWANDHTDDESGDSPGWAFVALLFYVGKIYE